MTITYTTAQLVKEKGYNIKSKRCYYPHRNIFESHNRVIQEDFTWRTKFIEESLCWDDEYYYAPHQSELQEWLLEKHGLFVSVQLAYNEWGRYAAHIEKLSLNGKTAILAADGTTIFSDQNSAMEEGLYEALKLIK